MRKTDKPFGFIVSIKWTIQNVISKYSTEGQTCYYRPKSSGYTNDFRQAGLFTKERALDIIAHCSGEISFLEVNGHYAKDMLKLNANPIEE